MKELVRQCEEMQVALKREKAQCAELEKEKVVTILAQNKVTERARKKAKKMKGHFCIIKFCRAKSKLKNWCRQMKLCRAEGGRWKLRMSRLAGVGGKVVAVFML